jgi:hypothetical protein
MYNAHNTHTHTHTARTHTQHPRYAGMLRWKRKNGVSMLSRSREEETRRRVSYNEQFIRPTKETPPPETKAQTKL